MSHELDKLAAETDSILAELAIEDDLRARAEALASAQDALFADVDAHYRPLVVAQLEAKNFDNALAIIRKVPCDLTKAFLLDTYRQAQPKAPVLHPFQVVTLAQGEFPVRLIIYTVKASTPQQAAEFLHTGKAEGVESRTMSIFEFGDARKPWVPDGPGHYLVYDRPANEYHEVRL